MHTPSPILVTGSHRSGSTWAGLMLAAAADVGYIHEPFNNELRISVNPKPFKQQFYYLCEENEENYEAVFDGIINFKYPIISNLTNVRNLKDAADLFREQAIYFLHKLHNRRPLVKDPIAFFSAEWLYRKFNMDVLIMIRHPAAFCSSLKIKDWHFNFNHFLDQPLLMQRFLDGFEDEIREFSENEKDVIDQATLLWNCIHHTIAVYQQDHPEWIFARHEDMSQDPVNLFRKTYQAFGLEFTADVKKRIEESSGAHNPVEQQATNEFVRDSRKNIKNWKKRLESSEIDLIRKNTAEISSLFYSESEW